MMPAMMQMAAKTGLDMVMPIFFSSFSMTPVISKPTPTRSTFKEIFKTFWMQSFLR
jgi:hypothetical protein